MCDRGSFYIAKTSQAVCNVQVTFLISSLLLLETNWAPENQFLNKG